MLTAGLTKRKLQGNLRKLAFENTLIDFASNDYLGQSRSKVMQEAIQVEWARLRQTYPNLTGCGSTGSRLLTGNHSYAEELEAQIAQFHGFDAGLLFATGYMANMGLISAVATSTDLIFYDTHIHASTHDGIRLSAAQARPVRHNDLNHLEKQLSNNSCTGCRFVCIESIYSTDGSLAPLIEIAKLCARYGAKLIVDEAHAVGVFGPNGRGLVAQHKAQDGVFAQVTTFGKALGCQGAIVLGSHLLKEYLINFARSCVYSTALPLFSLAVIQCAYKIFPSMDVERERLLSLCNIVQKSLTPIQALKIKDRGVLKQASECLAKAGFDVRAIMSPTVSRKDEHLRICLHAFNTQSEVNALLECIQKIEGEGEGEGKGEGRGGDV